MVNRLTGPFQRG